MILQQASRICGRGIKAIRPSGSPGWAPSVKTEVRGTDKKTQRIENRKPLGLVANSKLLIQVLALMLSPCLFQDLKMKSPQKQTLKCV